MTLEKTIQRSIMTYLTSLKGAWFFKPTITNCNGCPDIIGVYRGKFITFEVKAEGKTATKIQWAQMELISIAGGICFVVYDLETVKNILEQIYEY